VYFTSVPTFMGGTINFQVQNADTTQPIDWTNLESAIQLPHTPSAAYPAIFANLTANVGSTVASYQAALDADATYLSQLGEYTGDVSRLLAFELNKAAGVFAAQTLTTVTDVNFPAPGLPLTFVRSFQQGLDGRSTMGPLGLGWTDNWQISASTV